MNLLPYRFKYQREDAIHPTTGEVVTRFYPMIPLRLISKKRKTTDLTGLLDSGSDGIIIPHGIAQYLGLELEDAPPMKVAGGNDIERWTSEVSIVLGRGGRYTDEIQCREVGIPKVGDPPILIGREPVFDLFEITFIEAERTISMKPYKHKKGKGKR